MIRKRKRGRVEMLAQEDDKWCVTKSFKPPPAPKGYKWEYEPHAEWYYLRKVRSYHSILWLTANDKGVPAIGFMETEDEYGWTYDKADEPDVVPFMLSLIRLGLHDQ